MHGTRRTGLLFAGPPAFRVNAADSASESLANICSIASALGLPRPALFGQRVTMA
jgi:hypothetical protein